MAMMICGQSRLGTRTAAGAASTCSDMTVIVAESQKFSATYNHSHGQLNDRHDARHCPAGARAGRRIEAHRECHIRPPRNYRPRPGDAATSEQATRFRETD